MNPQQLIPIYKILMVLTAMQMVYGVCILGLVFLVFHRRQQ